MRCKTKHLARACKTTACRPTADRSKECYHRRHFFFTLWDLIKYRIRQASFGYSKKKKNRKKGQLLLRNWKRILKRRKNIVPDPTKQNIQNREELKQRYELMYDYITQGAMIRSRVCKVEPNSFYSVSSCTEYTRLSNTHATWIN